MESRLGETRLEPQTRLIESIRKLKQRCSIDEQLVEKLDLTPREMEGLLALSEGEAVACGDLAARLYLSPSRASRIFGRLIGRGYLLRAEDGRDRRCLRLSLSARGAECRRRIVQSEEECARRLFARLDKDQLRRVEEGIEILLHIL